MKKILLVDSIKDSSSITMNILQSRYQITLAEDIDEAASVLVKLKPDIVLINHIMPGKTAVDVLNKLSKKGDKDFLAMMMTNVKDMDIVVDAILHGFDGFIKMPVDADLFAIQLEKAEKIHQIRTDAKNFVKVKATKAMSITFAHYTRNLLTPLIGYLPQVEGVIPAKIYKSFEESLNKINKLTYKVEALIEKGELNEFSYMDGTDFYDLDIK